MFNIFRKKETISFETVNYEEFSALHPNALYDLYKSKKHGFHVKNFLSEGELKAILSRYSVLENKNLANTSVGYTYPMVFAEFSLRNKELNDEEKAIKSKLFFENSENFNLEFINDFGFDIRSKIENFFNSISGGREVCLPKGVDNVGSYPFGNFRYLKPNGGGVSIHCGNFFQTRFESFYKHLMEKVNVLNQMSYFIMLQEAESGGELDVFNLRWEKGQTKKDNLEDVEIILPNGKILKPDTNNRYVKMKISPKPGDMILFQGGNIWHRVANILGSKPRITFGGFIGFSHSEKEIYYWT